MTAHAGAGALVDATWLAGHLEDRDLRLVEVDVSGKAYDEGHLPGAVLWDVYRDLLDDDYRVIGKEALEELLARSGVSRETCVAFYGYAAAFGYWLLSLYRHPSLRLLDGSRAAWLADRRPMSIEVPHPPRSVYRLPEPDPEIRALRDRVEAATREGDPLLMDVRSVPEYRGERFWPSRPPQGSERAGHVPSALLVPIELTWNDDGTFRAPEALRSLFESRGFLPDREVITYCTVGGRASQAWFVLTQVLGYRRVRVYDGSWAEWGRLAGVPVETGLREG
jgi:thiosulfate/3-mercaptopyruvate sulfurtransferase